MQLTALLDRLTLRKIIALIALVVVVLVVVVLLAYAHNIPLPGGPMRVGDVPADLDIYALVLLLGLLNRGAGIVFEQAAATKAGFSASTPGRCETAQADHWPSQRRGRRMERDVRPRLGLMSCRLRTNRPAISWPKNENRKNDAFGERQFE